MKRHGYSRLDRRRFLPLVGRGSFGKNETKKAAAKHVKVFVERLQNNRVFPGRMAAWFEIELGSLDHGVVSFVFGFTSVA